jgi:hypothetical protein
MKVSAYLVAPALALSGLALAAAPASAHTMSPSVHTCTGTGTAPGVLAGTYSGDVVIKGFCQVNGGAAVVQGNLTVTPDSALNATFALNDVAHSGTSSLLVQGSVWVQKGAVLAMGCLPVHSPCSDDPKAATGGTLTGVNEVHGSLSGSDALAVIVHASKILGNVDQKGGGGGPAAMTCKVPTSGVFAALQSPVFSDYEDNSISGKLSVTGLQTCWFGALRDNVGASVRVDGNKFGDPDADEVNSNMISGSMSCFGNTPAVQFGDAAGGTPNKVEGNASGQCAFSVRLHNPVPNGPLTPISVQG